ncbi:CYTH domain-containing protein [Salegentibacter sp. F188]|uniref:CYTH domain-containing protein n=1 Tax=Autumnicola patrickiae TaxID=3075591 RepID=A0ABU3E5T9_9FLAO|nr:CYTH domain-containing protein [Salegentibacter sp. F188]MDT0691292.1 CYTH domain-containing protein [Salegentibacter sp. F188]
MVEIERKFLVISDDFKFEAEEELRIKQGYLNSHPDRAVRVRTKGTKAFITVKGKSSESGLSRFEWEKEISPEDAEELLKLCEPGIIDKTRYLAKSGPHTFEVDKFFGANEGLIVAEVELSSETEEFKKPKWLGKEVTGDVRYYNSQLCKEPYKNWKNNLL